VEQAMLEEEFDSLVARYQVAANDPRESAHLEVVADETVHFVHEHTETEMLEVNNDVRVAD
jgi:hypothetical protein